MASVKRYLRLVLIAPALALRIFPLGLLVIAVIFDIIRLTAGVTGLASSS